MESRVIYELLSTNQWIVVNVIALAVFAAAWEIILYRITPYDYRRWQTGDEPPPVIGGIVYGLLTVGVIHAILGSIQGLVWLWNN